MRVSIARAAALVWAGPGTLLGLAAAATIGGRPRVRDGVLDVAGSRGFCRLHRRLGFRAITLGHVVLRCVAPGSPPAPPPPALWAHELAHVRQWERLGPLMLVLYPLASLAGYRRNPFEVAARRAAGEEP